MTVSIGTKAWRQKFDATHKLGCNLNLYGEEARAVIEFMEAEELPNPAAAVRVLLGNALSTYPEWAASAATRRAAAIEVRLWMLQRCAAAVREIGDELEANMVEDYAKFEARVMEAASNAVLNGDDLENPR